MVNRTELAAFLRARRERLQPREVGLPGGQRRRTPGLRRQEVAELAGLSVDYYIRLEQGRGPRPSRQVLAALARALMLSADERAYLFRLGGEAVTPPAGPSRTVPPGIARLLDLLPSTPAYVVAASYDILAWNRPAVYFVGDLSSVPSSERNMIRWMFSRPAADASWSDSDTVAFTRSVVADLRAAYAAYPGNRDISALVTELLALSPQFASMWAAQEVSERHSTVKQVDHPVFGPLQFSCEVLHIADTDQRLIVYVAEPGSATAEAFGRMATLAINALAARPCPTPPRRRAPSHSARTLASPAPSYPCTPLPPAPLVPHQPPPSRVTRGTVAPGVNPDAAVTASSGQRTRDARQAVPKSRAHGPAPG